MLQVSYPAPREPKLEQAGRRSEPDGLEDGGVKDMTSLPGLPPPSKRRSLLLFGMLRAAATIAGLVAAYYLLPFDHLSDATSVLLLVVGLVGVIVIVVWEVRGILNSQYPAYKAVEALTITAPLFLLLFASAYYLLERATPTSFSQPLSRTDALYFTVTTFSTVGYGDITAKSQGARLMVIFQMLADLVVLGFGVKVIFGGGGDGTTAPDGDHDRRQFSPVRDAIAWRACQIGPPIGQEHKREPALLFGERACRSCRRPATLSSPGPSGFTSGATHSSSA